MTTPPWWSAPCPACGGPAVFRFYGEVLVGACADLEVPCYWSDSRIIKDEERATAEIPGLQTASREISD